MTNCEKCLRQKLFIGLQKLQKIKHGNKKSNCCASVAKKFFFNCMNLKLNGRSLSYSHFPDSNQVTQRVFFSIYGTLYFETVGFHILKSLRSLLQCALQGRPSWVRVNSIPLLEIFSVLHYSLSRWQE